MEHPLKLFNADLNLKDVIGSPQNADLQKTDQTDDYLTNTPTDKMRTDSQTNSRSREDFKWLISSGRAKNNLHAWGMAQKVWYSGEQKSSKYLASTETFARWTNSYRVYHSKPSCRTGTKRTKERQSQKEH